MTTPPADGDGYVRYPTRALLDRIDAKLDAIDAKLDSKASAAFVREIADGLSKAVERITGIELGIEHEQRTRESYRTTKERVWNVILGVALVIVTLIGILGVHI